MRANTDTMLNTLKVGSVIAAVVVCAWLIKGQIDRQYHKGQADAIAAQGAVIDSIRAVLVDSAQAARDRADRIAAEADSIAADAQRDREQAETRVRASRDSVAILRSRLDTITDPVINDLVEQYETVIAQQDTVIASVTRQLEAERRKSVSLSDALVAVELERDNLLTALDVRDREIAALRDALDSGSLLPQGFLGDVLGVAAGIGIGALIR